MPSMKGSKLFTIVELLEAIIIHLPQASILVIQRVNSTFRDTIKHSPRIQRKLFMALRSASTPTNSSSSSKPAINPLARKLLTAGGLRGHLDLQGSVQHPLLRLHLRGPVPEGLIYIPWPRSSKGNWRDMWISDPPCELYVCGKITDSPRFGATKLGPLYDRLLDWDRHVEIRHRAEIKKERVRRDRECCCCIT